MSLYENEVGSPVLEISNPWENRLKFSRLLILPEDIKIAGAIPNGIKVQCIDGRFNPEDGGAYVRIPGAGLGLAADVYSALAEVWGEQTLKRHEEFLIKELQLFFGGKISGHTDDHGCETGFCGCGHVKKTVFMDDERADENLRSFLLNIAANPEIFDQEVLTGIHEEQVVVHAGRFDVPSVINGAQAFVYHGEYHQAMIEALSERLAKLVVRLEYGDAEAEGVDITELQDRIREKIGEISGERIEVTVERLANGLEHIKFEGPSETELEIVKELKGEADKHI